MKTTRRSVLAGLALAPSLGLAGEALAQKPGGTLVQTSAKSLPELNLPETVGTVGICNAVKIAMEIFRRPITNTLMLGAFARTTGVVDLEFLKQALRDSEFRDAGLEQNLTALQRGYDETVVHRIERRAAA